MTANKNDTAARALWGAAYGDIPKSVFAVAAWHLANLASETADAEGAAEGRFLEEIETLGRGGHLPAAQAARAAKAARALLETMDLDPLVADLIADRTGAP